MEDVKMELGKQIRKYRNELSLSQDELAERVYVSRQTITNWENDKSYPDVHSLVLLSEVFGSSIDKLIKGDVEIMKEEISKEDRQKFARIGKLYNILFSLMIISPIPLIHFLKFAGMIIWLLVVAVTINVACMVEKQKKMFNIRTYKEILAFMEGKRLDEIARAREEGKRPYQQAALALGFGVLALAIELLFMIILK